MHFITNRLFDSSKSGFNKFCNGVNPLGPNELAAVEVTGPVSKPVIKQLSDKLSVTQASSLIRANDLDLPAPDTSTEPGVHYYASLRVACETFKRARADCKSVLLYVHGYNNDVKDVYKTALELERLYGVIVIVFTWPANGGGALSGTLSYLADKRDARSSKDALNRTIDLVGKYHELLTNAARKKFEHRVASKYPENLTRQREEFAKLIDRYCTVSVSMFCHSMGNYVLKHALNSELAESRKLIFDNIALIASDTNNEDHRRWVESLQVRNALYIGINENDFALSWSRRKPGEQQKARLGHYLKKLDAANAVYVDFTRERSVGKSHSYFDASTVKKNSGVKRFFKGAFGGDSMAARLDYVSHNNTYRPK